MNKFVAPLAALAFVFSAGIASADEAAGKITTVDSETLVLEDGTTFTIGEGVSTEGLEPGTEVTVSYEEKDGQMVITEVTAN